MMKKINLFEHEIILDISDKESLCYDYCLDLEWDSDTKIRSDDWNSFPLFEYKDNKIVSFDWEKYEYFLGTDRRVALSMKINELYNPFSELKILRKTLKYIMDKLKLNYPSDFDIMNLKIEEVISKIPKDKIK